jgi:hypothetical protein
VNSRDRARFEVVTYRGGAGCRLELLLAFVVAVVAEWTRRAPAIGVHRDGATVAFAVAAVGLLGFAVDAKLVGETPGTGAYLSGGLVAAVAAVLAALAFIRTLASGWSES